MPWRGAALVDGRPWPVADEETLWLPAGAHSVESARTAQGPHVVRLNADLKAARTVGPRTIEFSYQSAARAIAILDRTARRLEIDGSEVTPTSAGPKTLLLPRGQHLVTLTTD